MRKYMIAGFAALGLLVAACASKEQAAIDAQTQDISTYQITLDRVDKFVHLPACDATATTNCADPAAKAELKGKVAAHTGDATKAAANADVTASLVSHNINCGAASTDTCP